MRRQTIPKNGQFALSQRRETMFNQAQQLAKERCLAERDNEPPFRMLKSGRMIDSTASWNPLIFAFVCDYFDVVNYVRIREDIFDLRRCLRVKHLNAPTKRDATGKVTEDFGDKEAGLDQYEIEQQEFRNFLTLIIENGSMSLFVLLDYFYNMITFEDLIHIVSVLLSLPITKECLNIKGQVLKMILDSQAFKSLYFERVKHTGYESYEGSFQEFFERLFFPIVFTQIDHTESLPTTTKSLFGLSNENQAASSVNQHHFLIKLLEENLCREPYNSGFGMYIYLMRNKVRSFFPNTEQLLKEVLSSGLRDYDVFRITESVDAQYMKEIEQEYKKVASKQRGIYQKFI
mmetsp:Transcript_1954/g.3394  ORF Transcript_1954/g.3394 Transcript_1954/m.3394 type:complete len:346 (+) Transcript_1954:397-1434(+)